MNAKSAEADLGQTVDLHDSSLSRLRVVPEARKEQCQSGITIAFDCFLTMLAVFTLVLPAITKIPAPLLPAIKKMLERVKSTSQANQNRDNGELSTVPRKERHASSSVLSLPADTICSSVLHPKTPPARPARPLSPCSFASLPLAQMRPCG